MKQKIAIAALLCTSAFCMAQQGVVSSGKTALGASGAISYSIGQNAFNLAQGSSGSITEGIAQTYLIQYATGIKRADKIELRVNVAPNPTTDYLILSMNEYKMKNLSYVLYSTQGALLKQDVIDAEDTKIAMSEFTASSYILCIRHKNKQIKQFQIIKK